MSKRSRKGAECGVCDVEFTKWHSPTFASSSSYNSSPLGNRTVILGPPAPWER